jgi:hypothetical protein
MMRLGKKHIAAALLLMLTHLSQAREPVQSSTQAESDDLLEVLKANGFAYIERQQIVKNASGEAYTQRVKDHIAWFRRQGVKTSAQLTKGLLVLVDYPIEEILEPKAAWLKSQGAKDIGKLIGSCPEVLSHSIEGDLKTKIAWLQQQGVKDTGKLISDFPQVLRFSLEDNLKPKIAWLREQGVENIGKLLDRFPAFLTLSVEKNLKPKAEWFASQGVHDVGKLINIFPQVMSLSIDGNLKTKFEWLRDMEIQDIEKLINSFPQILTLSLDNNLKPKVAWFTDQGFKDIPKLIETFPRVLSYSLTDNLAPKVIEYVEHWKIGISEIEESPKLFEEDLPQIQGVRRMLDDIAKMAGDSGFDFSSLTIEQRKYLIRHMSEDLIFAKLKDVRAISPEKRRLSELTASERSILIGLYRKPESLLRLLFSTGRGRARVLKEVSCHVDFLQERLKAQ